MNRLPPESLQTITGRKLPSAQKRWFHTHFGVDLPADRAGPILTEATFDALVAKAAGVLDGPAPKLTRPTVRMRRGGMA